MSVQIHYRFMSKNDHMTGDTHFNTLSKKGQQAVVDFFDEEMVDTVNRNNCAILGMIYGTRHIWIEVEELKKLINEKN